MEPWILLSTRQSKRRMVWPELGDCMLKHTWVMKQNNRVQVNLVNLDSASSEHTSSQVSSIQSRAHFPVHPSRQTLHSCSIYYSNWWKNFSIYCKGLYWVFHLQHLPMGDHIAAVQSCLCCVFDFAAIPRDEHVCSDSGEEKLSLKRKKPLAKPG